jgi:hypothetical protein
MSGGDYWIEFAAITPETTGAYSGGERRVHTIAAALGTHTEIDLAENITGLDRAHAHLVLAALAHTMGTHQHDEIRRNPTTGDLELIDLDSLCPWPAAQPSQRSARLSTHVNEVREVGPTVGTPPDRHAEPLR